LPGLTFNNTELRKIMMKKMFCRPIYQFSVELKNPLYEKSQKWAPPIVNHVKYLYGKFTEIISNKLDT
ncbi:hypothetical protein L9F63_023035, partial [Diploptera punctata]